MNYHSAVHRKDSKYLHGAFHGAFHEVIASENGWDLCRTHDCTPDYLRIEGSMYLHHNCQSTSVFSATRDTYEGLSWPCKWCEKKIPEGLQGLFVLMTGDMETTNE